MTFQNTVLFFLLMNLCACGTVEKNRDAGPKTAGPIPPVFQGVWAIDTMDCAGLFEDGPTLITIGPDGSHMIGFLKSVLLNNPRHFVGLFGDEDSAAGVGNLVREEFILEPHAPNDRIKHITRSERLIRITEGKSTTYQGCDW